MQPHTALNVTFAFLQKRQFRPILVHRWSSTKKCWEAEGTTKGSEKQKKTKGIVSLKFVAGCKRNRNIFVEKCQINFIIRQHPAVSWTIVIKNLTDRIIQAASSRRAIEQISPNSKKVPVTKWSRKLYGSDKAVSSNTDIKRQQVSMNILTNLSSYADFSICVII